MWNESPSALAHTWSRRRCVGGLYRFILCDGSDTITKPSTALRCRCPDHPVGCTPDRSAESVRWPVSIFRSPSGFPCWYRYRWSSKARCRRLVRCSEFRPLRCRRRPNGRTDATRYDAGDLFRASSQTRSDGRVSGKSLDVTRYVKQKKNPIATIETRKYIVLGDAWSMVGNVGATVTVLYCYRTWHVTQKY